MAKKDVLKGRSIVNKNIFDQANQSIEEIKRLNPIVDYFKTKGIELKSNSNGQYMGLCPFHDDHNPSLSVSSDKNVFKCFGCGKAGTVIDAVANFENVSIREAIKILQSSANKPQAKTDELILNLKSQSDKSTELPEESINLTQIAEHYHKELYNHREATEYLNKRGITNPEIISTYQIGFCDGKSLLNKLSKNQVGSLIKKGILKGNGQEAFASCLIFPIFDENNQIVHFYARNIDDKAKVKHLYLSGNHKSVFNRKAVKVYSDRIILTESIIDALSLIQVGINNVWSCYGAQVFTDEMLDILKEHRAAEIVTAFDNDEAGIKGAEKLREKLIGDDFAVRTIYPPKCKDWNDSLREGISKDEIQSLIEKAEVFKPSKAGSLPVELTKIPSGYRFKFDEAIYEVLNFKDDFAGPLKIILKIEAYGKPHCDDFNLYAYRSRENFIKQSEYLTGLPADKGTEHLSIIIKKLEEIRNKKLSSGKEEQKEEELTEEEKEIGMRFLTNPQLFDELKQDLDLIGCVGENKGKVLLYLVATSRLRVNPIPAYVFGRSSAGKSYLVKTVLKLIPSDSKFIITKVSPEVLYYMEKGLKNKVIMVGEFDGAEDIEYLLREMVSDGSVSKLVTFKDAETGLPKPYFIESEGPISLISTSAKPEDINPENLNRCILMHVDESAEQTQRILEYQRFIDSKEGYLSKLKAEEIIKKHHIVQKLLEDILVFNIFGDELDFPTLLLLARRAHFNFLRVIDMVAFQLQKLHEIREMEVKGKMVRYIETDLRDYEIAYNLLMDGIMENTLDEMSVNAKNLHKIMLEQVTQIAMPEGKKIDTVYIERQEVMIHSGWTEKQVRTAVKVLINYGYLEIVSGKDRGKTHKYRVLNIESRVKELLKKIPTPEEMEKRLSAKGKL